MSEEKAVEIAKDNLHGEFSKLASYSATLEEYIWLVRFKEEGNSGLKSCSFEIKATDGTVLNEVCAE